MPDLYEKFIVPQGERIVQLDGRMANAENDIKVLKGHNVKHYESRNAIKEEIASIVATLKILMPIMYSVLGISLLAFLAQMYNQFVR